MSGEVRFETVVDAADVSGLLLSPAGCQRWLGSTEFASPGDPFKSPVAAELAGTVEFVDPSSGTATLDISGRKVGVSIAAEGDMTVVAIRDANAIEGSTTLMAWERTLAVARKLLGDFRRRVPRQAVVVIHGIGEQRPGTTIRGFVDSVIEETDATVWSKPDRLAESFELRRHQAQQTDSVPQTDYFEYYWAHEVSSTTVDQVKGWIVGLLRRPWGSIPSQFRALWVMVRLTVLFVLLAVGFVALGFLVEVADWLIERVEWWNGWKEGAVLSALLAAITGAVSGFLRLSLGDAVRYLTSKPENISIRQSIRSSGLKLLRDLHESGAYDRVVVVGHSLGSVIGYDLLRLYWAEVCAKHGSPPNRERSALRAYEQQLGRYLDPSPGTSATDNASGTTGQPEAERAPPPDRELKLDLWAEQRVNGNPWLITDFITLGSPLTYASLLIADSPNDLERQKLRRELPTDPPEAEGARVSYEVDYRADDAIREISLLNHAALFAVTTWTNIYFKNRLLLFGDPIGGPVRAQFGAGVCDVPVDHHWKVGLHSKYWQPGGRPADDARDELFKALRLGSREELEELADRLPMAERLRGLPA